MSRGLEHKSQDSAKVGYSCSQPQMHIEIQKAKSFMFYIDQEKHEGERVKKSIFTLCLFY